MTQHGRSSRYGWLVLASVLLALPTAARAQPLTEADRLPTLRMAPSSSHPGSRPSVATAERRAPRNETRAPALQKAAHVVAPDTQSPPPVTLVQGAMGGMPMAMIMTGDTMFEMATGACTAGVVVGIIAAVAAPPVTGSMVLTNAAIGCGIGIVATIAGMAGMSGARAIAGDH